MIEMIVMVWFVGWVLWMLSFFVLGSLKEDFAWATLGYALLPFIVVLGILYFVFILPIAVIASEKVRNVVIESRKRHLSGYIKEEV